MTETLSSAEEFTRSLAEHAPRFDLRLEAAAVARLRAYYELLATWNTRLHLVAPCSPQEFATRHVLESLLAVEHMREGASVVDVGSGAGLPIIPCLILRPDLRSTLIESSKKKAVFLREALRLIGSHERAEVVAERFEMTEAPEAQYVTCRALERFTEVFPVLLEWSPPESTLLLFGGESLRAEIERSALDFRAVHIPESERRSLFVMKRESPAASQNR
ncbi:MAG TPA: 16S rRNA (guanine(527)-N(7))-methyltransferase RsmG [Pyrinomonadaceae bacterium]|nr:16S rRNA (guanine(527)-N(7))-methyltransferase RsmG [Pyrinomonadaceae bacterium]